MVDELILSEDVSDQFRRKIEWHAEIDNSVTIFVTERQRLSSKTVAMTLELEQLQELQRWLAAHLEGCPSG